MLNKWSLNFVILCFLYTECNSQSRCGCEFPHGHVPWCSDTDSLTSYRCDEGYEETMSWLRCSSSGQWVPAFGSSHMTEPFCIPKSCPDQIPNGALSSSCSAKVGCTCNYSCDTGYTKTDANIVCETSANWSTNPHSLCKRTNFQQCPYEVRNGDLDKDCSRHPGDICTFICREGYTGSQQQTVYCTSSRRWNQSLQSVCKQIMCPFTIPNGYILASCSREYKAYCNNYECYNGYDAPAIPTRLRCNYSGQWEWEESQDQPCLIHCSANTTTPSPPAYKTVGLIICGSVLGFIVFVFVVSFCIAFILDPLKQCCLKQFTASHPVEYQNSEPSSHAEVTYENYHEVISLYYEYPTWNVDYTLREQEQDDESSLSSQMQLRSNNTECNFVEDPPAYSSITPSIPEEAPPSYKQVTANPADYKL